MSAVTVTTTKQQITSPDWGVLVIQNDGATDMFIDQDPAMTAATARMRVPAGATWEDPANRGQNHNYWLVTESGTTTARWGVAY